MDSGLLVIIMFKLVFDYFCAKNKTLDMVSSLLIFLFCGYQLVYSHDPASRALYGVFLLMLGGYMYWRMYKTSESLLEKKEKSKNDAAKKARKSEK